MDKIKESDLYQPIKDYLDSLGYDTKGEVKDCDITAIKDGELIVVELKKGFTIELLYQAIERQKIADSVYVAIPLPKRGYKNPHYKDMVTLCKRLEEAGAATVMPLGAPIGTNKGLQTRDFLRIIIEQATIPVVVDAGIGAPSHAAEAMEMGASACLVNTAIAVAGNPTAMAQAFKQAVEAGRMAYEAGLGLQADSFVAEASSPLTAFLNE